MTREAAIAALTQGATATTSQYLTVNREHLLIALGAIPETQEEEPSVRKPDDDR